jgi:hypothetical protein
MASTSRKRSRSPSAELPDEKKLRDKSPELDSRRDLLVTPKQSQWEPINQPATPPQRGHPRAKHKQEQYQQQLADTLTPRLLYHQRSLPVTPAAKTPRESPPPPLPKIPGLPPLNGINLEHILQGDTISLGLEQKREIYRWMRRNNARMIGNHRTEFVQLLDTLGFTDPTLAPLVQKSLHTKLRHLIMRIGVEFRKTGVITVSKEQGKKEVVRFAKWTDSWLEDDWDGTIVKPAWTKQFLAPEYDDEAWLGGEPAQPRTPAANPDSSPTGTKPLVVQEQEADNSYANAGLAGQRRGSDAMRDLEESNNRGFLSSYRTMHGTPEPNYPVDLSQLPQYQDVPLAPVDRNNPHLPQLAFLNLVAAVDDHFRDQHNEEEGFEADDEDSDFALVDEDIAED